MKVFVVFVIVFGASVDLTHQSPEWNYEDETHWPGNCNTGGRQSPINIISRDAVVDYHQSRIKGPLTMRGYSAVDAYAMNNGHTLEWSAVPGPSTLPILSGGPLEGNYTFLQFHLHWLSEHAIDGLKYPLEIHLVHVKTGLTIEEAIKRPDGLAVIGVMVEVMEQGSHYALEEIIDMVPDLIMKTEEEVGNASIIDLTRLISQEPQSFFTYEGSLTTPDCHEAVTWIVMEKPLEMSSVQYKVISKVEVGGVANYRSLQPTNRQVYRTASCASLASLSLSLSILSALWHCTWHLASAAHQGLCMLGNIKKGLFGRKLGHCSPSKVGIEN